MMGFSAGQEIDSYCTKCRLDLGHLVVAVWEGAIKKVRCKICGSEHQYRRPKSAPRDSKRHGPTPKLSREDLWQRLVAGRDISHARQYSQDAIFALGEFLRHSLFGSGVVARVLPGGKMEVLFQQGSKILVHGRGG